MDELRTAEIIAVGSELLTPTRIDTNSLFLTERLNEIGVAVRLKHVVGDNTADLTSVLRAALARADVVITTGGLGPTDDDLTRDVVAELLGRPMHQDRQILESIERRFARRGWPMPAINRRQAQVPAGATVLPNANGTAPGLLLESDGRVIALLPGPPRELQPMFVEHVLPVLALRTGGRRLRRRIVAVTGRSESQVEEIAQPVYSKLGTPEVPIETTILASPGQIELRLSAAGHDAAELDRLLDEGTAALVAALGDVVFSVEGQTLEAVAGDRLRARGWTIAAAESCTGGLLLGRLTTIPGSSAWVKGGVVAYSNEVKIEQLGVSPAVLDAHGAVSEPVATAMAEGVRARLKTDVGVAITGIAGPGGGSEHKPVGTVVVAAVTASDSVVRTFHFPGDRDAIRGHSTAAALDMVRRLASQG